MMVNPRALVLIAFGTLLGAVFGAPLIGATAAVGFVLFATIAT